MMMYDNFLMINGKKLPLTEEQVKLLTEDVKPFDRGDAGDTCWFIDETGIVREFKDYTTDEDDKLFAAANACRDEEIMTQRALHEKMNRLLWRYSEQHGGDADWYGNERHYFVSLSAAGEPIVDWLCGIRAFGPIYFKEKSVADGAIEDVVKPFLAEHPEFVW